MLWGTSWRFSVCLRAVTIISASASESAACAGMLTAAAPDRIEAIAIRSAVCLDGFPSGARFMARTFIPGSPILDARCHHYLRSHRPSIFLYACITTRLAWAPCNQADGATQRVECGGRYRTKRLVRRAAALNCRIDGLAMLTSSRSYRLNRTIFI